MKCYQKAFILGNEFSDENFTDPFEMVNFWCPEQFFKDYDIVIETSKCTWTYDIRYDENETREENSYRLIERRKRCKECWCREFKIKEKIL